MLDHLRRRAEQALAQATQAMLITSGAAGLQASAWPCEARGLRLFLLVPTRSDHVLNLEARAEVVIAADHWRLEGRADRSPADAAQDLSLQQLPEARWSLVIVVRPERLHLLRPTGWGDCETLLIDE